MNTDTPETDAMVSADQHHLEDDNFFPASIYWRMCDLARTLERKRDELKRWTSVNGVIDLQRERDEARKYADKLAEGLPDGMLPKDVEVLREANLNLAIELTAITEQRDEWKAKYTQQNKDLGCEMMDPNGTIWDHAKKVQTELWMWRDGNIMHEVHRNELEKVEQERDRLAEALRVATAYPLSESWYKQAIEALATLKP
jgi:hypothetical protein